MLVCEMLVKNSADGQGECCEGLISNLKFRSWEQKLSGELDKTGCDICGQNHRRVSAGHVKNKEICSDTKQNLFANIREKRSLMVHRDKKLEWDSEEHSLLYKN